jgi:hypothetical protein
VETVSAERIVVEGLDSHGHVQWRERVVLDDGRRTFTIGRSAHADVPLDDPYAAALHASVEVMPDGRLLASDLGSVNGLIVGGKRCGNAGALELPDNTLQIGRTRLRVRTGQERLAPERPYRLSSASVRGPAWIAAIAALVSVLQLAYASWLGAPRDLTMSIVTSLWTAGFITAAWVAFWALLSRIMRGEWRWLRHAAIFLGVTATLDAVMGVAGLSEFVFAFSLADNRYLWLGAVALGAALFLHLTQASSLAPGRAALVACSIPVLLAAGAHWLYWRSQVRDVNYTGAHVRIYPPGLRLRPSDTLEGFFDKAASLRERAGKRLADVLADEPAREGEN